MSDRDETGAPRLRVDRLAAAMDAARTRARAAAEAQPSDRVVATPSAVPENLPSTGSAGGIDQGPVPVEIPVATAEHRPVEIPEPAPDVADTAALGHAADVHDKAADVPFVRRAHAEPLLLTDDLRIPKVRSAETPDRTTTSDDAPASEPEPTPGTATIVVTAAVSLSSPGVNAARSPALLSLSGVATDIGNHRILQDVMFNVPNGAVTVLLGRGGAGKTTTLRTIMGLSRARAGSIMMAGDRIDRWPTHRIARAGLGYVPQAMSIFTDLTVTDNITLGARSGPVPRDRLDWLTGLFPPLATVLRSPAGNLSLAQQRMLALARALVERRRLYLIDEPTSGLLPDVADTVVAALRDLKLQGATILMVERDFAVARALGDVGVVFDGGRVAWTGTMADLDADPALRTRLLGQMLGEVA